MDVTVTVEGPQDHLGDICKILNKYDIVYDQKCVLRYSYRAINFIVVVAILPIIYNGG